MPPELSDEEVTQLRARADAADKAAEREAALSKKHAESEAALAASRKKYDDDMRQVAAYLESQKQPTATAAAADEEDQDAIVSRKDLRRASEETARRSAENQAQHASVILKNQRSINKQLAAQRLGPKVEKYMAEIDAHLDRLDPAVAAQPTAYDEVFKYVRSAHIDEELEEARREREAGDEENHEESGRSSSGEGTAPRAIPRTESISPGTTATATRAISRLQAQKPRMTEEEQRVARGFGMTAEEYKGEFATDDVLVANDPWGFKGRQRV